MNKKVTQKVRNNMGFFNFMLLSLLLVVNTLIAIKNKEHIEEIKRMIELLESEE